MMLSELFNIPASFQDFINKILFKKLNIFVIIYLEKNFIYIKNINQDYIEAMS